MENSNPSNNSTDLPAAAAAAVEIETAASTVNNNNNNTRTPFTNLSQVDADLALARTLQDQERAYMMLRMNGGGGVSSDHDSWETGSYVNDDDDDDEFDHHNSEYNDDDDDDDDDVDDDVIQHEDAFEIGEDEAAIGAVVELDPASFPNDEAYARALQDAEDQEMAARLLALTRIHEMVTDEDEEEEEDDSGHGGGVNSQDTWDDVDPDELSYEELIALGEVVGTESRGLSSDSIASLRSITYKSQSSQTGNSETCVICRLDYEDGDNLILLSCKHSYHSECITNWLQINKVCPVCSTEVTTSGTAS